MKTLLNILFLPLLVVVFFAGLWVGAWVEKEQSIEPYQTVREQVMSLQRRVGCRLIDAKIGPETILLVNQAVKNEERELFNSFAEPYHTDSGRPE